MAKLPYQVFRWIPTPPSPEQYELLRTIDEKSLKLYVKREVKSWKTKAHASKPLTWKGLGLITLLCVALLRLADGVDGAHRVVNNALEIGGVLGIFGLVFCFNCMISLIWTGGSIDRAANDQRLFLEECWRAAHTFDYPSYVVHVNKNLLYPFWKSYGK